MRNILDYFSHRHEETERRAETPGRVSAALALTGLFLSSVPIIMLSIRDPQVPHALAAIVAMFAAVSLLFVALLLLPYPEMRYGAARLPGTWLTGTLLLVDIVIAIVWAQRL